MVVEVLDDGEGVRRVFAPAEGPRQDVAPDPQHGPELLVAGAELVVGGEGVEGLAALVVEHVAEAVVEADEAVGVGVLADRLALADDPCAGEDEEARVGGAPVQRLLGVRVGPRPRPESTRLKPRSG